jgi:hypothetical protein
MKTQGQFILMDLAEFATWLAAERVTRPIRIVQNHHTLIPSYRDFNGSNHFARLVAMKTHHVKVNRWADIGQNLTTFPDGTIAVSRPLNRIPAGIRGANAGGVCIEHLGNFDLGSDAMKPAHRDTVIQVNALLCRRFGLVPSLRSIVYHHWYDLDTGERNDGTRNNKSCPGTAFFGGNKPEHCAANLLPLVHRAMGLLGGAPGVLGTGRVRAASGLNVRGGPGTDAPILSTLADGDLVQIYDVHGSWRRIDGTEPRWVSGRFLQEG